MLSLLLFVIVLCAVVWAVRAIMAAFSIGEPISTVVYVLLVLFALATILDRFGHGFTL